MAGVVLEADGQHYISGNPTYLVPNIGSADALGELAKSNSYVLMPVAQAVEKLEDRRDTVTIESLLTTSDSAYVKTNIRLSGKRGRRLQRDLSMWALQLPSPWITERPSLFI